MKQLVATSQQLSRGFATRDLSPVGLSSLSFEFGRGGLAVDTNLENLNGGAGIDRGVLLITDRAGNNAEIDLTDVTTLNEVLQRINSNGIAAVTATVDGDHLVITDFSGQNGTLSVTSALGDTTAADLGIEGAAVGDTLTGGDINSLGGTTTLASLNDGNGVLVRDNVADFEIETRDGAIFQIDLGRIDAPMTTETLLSELNNGAGVTISSDGDNQDIAFVDRNGTQHDVDLTGVTTVGSLISRISSQTGGAIALSIAADGDRFTVTDLTGGTGPLKVLGAGTNGTDTAEDLGILQEDGVNDVSFDGQLVPNTISQAPATTLQQVIDRINSALDETEAANGGRVVAAIGGDGVSLEITDNTVGGGDTTVRSIPGINDFAAAQLGIEQTSATRNDHRSAPHRHARLGARRAISTAAQGCELPEPGSPATLTGQTLLEELFNGSGITTNGNPGSVDMRLRDRTGTNHDVELDGLTTVQDLIDAVNTATGGAVTMSIEGQSLRVDDQTGSTSDNLRITNRNGANVATELGIEINAPVDFVVGVDTEPIHSGTATIQITNRAGVSSVIDITGEQSIQNIISRINAEATDVTASLNQAGNGLLITDTSGGTQNLRILGDAAASLGIQGDVDSDTVEGQNLQLRYVAASSRLADLNYGRGIGTGTFRITDGLGQSAEVNIGTDSTSLYDIIAEINSRGLAINARVNDNGDGLLIEESLDEGETAFTQIKIETVSGTTARDLNILGESSTVAGGFIDGSYERVVDVTASDTLDELVAKINDAGAPVERHDHQYRFGPPTVPPESHLADHRHRGRIDRRRSWRRSRTHAACAGAGCQGVLRREQPRRRLPALQQRQQPDRRTAGCQHRPSPGQRRTGDRERRAGSEHDRGIDHVVHRDFQQHRLDDRSVRFLRRRDRAARRAARQPRRRAGPTGALPGRAAARRECQRLLPIPKSGRHHDRRRGTTRLRRDQVQ